MCTLGYLGDKIGRKWGSVFTASLMLIGSILLVATDAPTEKGFVIFYIISQVSSAASLALLSCVQCETILVYTAYVAAVLAQWTCLLTYLLSVCSTWYACTADVACGNYISCSTAFGLLLRFYDWCCRTAASWLMSKWYCTWYLCHSTNSPQTASDQSNFCCSSPLDTVWVVSTPWQLDLLLSVLRPRVVHLPERGAERYLACGLLVCTASSLSTLLLITACIHDSLQNARLSKLGNLHDTSRSVLRTAAAIVLLRACDHC